ncbi:SDR family oxidoreductase [Oceanicaulis sp. LC35]|uniref:SDR family oxidoreductase n=1 Tax=Oceanicaulis sp. LC35 TaxID=3349635 RepID=UPI003F8730A8
MTIQAALVTNATGYTGPAAVQALWKAGFTVYAQDRQFEDEAVWAKFQAGRGHIRPIIEADPERIITTITNECDSLPVIVSNDFAPAPSYAPEEAPIEALQLNYAKLVEAPFRLIQAALPQLKTQGGANIVMVTCNRMRVPHPGGAFPDAARSAANALVRSLAADLAQHQITLNAIAPNFFGSDAYYPTALYEGTEEGRTYIQDVVPAGRLAEPEEFEELIGFLAIAKSRFLTGAVIDFSGGWPNAPVKPPCPVSA